MAKSEVPSVAQIITAMVSAGFPADEARDAESALQNLDAGDLAQLRGGIAGLAELHPSALKLLLNEIRYLPRFRRRASTPVGEELCLRVSGAATYPATSRVIGIWVPAAYESDSPACVHVQLDGLTDALKEGLDELVSCGEIPVTIAIGVPAGDLTDATGRHLPQQNRSREFDTVSDELARYILQDVLPRVDGLRTADGRVIRLSADGSDRSVGGGSTGAAAAFGMAWHRPHEFPRVLSCVGTYVGMRGAFQFPVLIRKSEPKPIRVFLQDGVNDWVDGPFEDAGDWWLGNLAMECALTASGYDVKHVWGEGGHSGWHGDFILLDAFRWLWRDYPQPIAIGVTRNEILSGLSSAPPTWKRVAGSWAREEFPARPVVPFDDAVGAALTLDGRWVAISRRGSRRGWRFNVDSHGIPFHGDPFYRFLVSDESDDSGAGALAFDSLGTLYAVSALGIQVFDDQGRVRAVINAPEEPLLDLRIVPGSTPAIEVLTASGIYRRSLPLRLGTQA